MNAKTKRELPQSKIKAALLAEEVGLNWADKFPHFVVSRLSPQSLQAGAAQLQQLCQDSHNNNCELRQNTVDLLALNVLINKGLNTLKSHIKIRCWENNQHNTEYAKYGLEVRKRSYQLPADNDLRQFALQLLLSKLQEVNNPIANQAQGLQFWLDLQTRHAQLWQNSKQLRARRSLLAQETDALTDKILLALQHIRKGLSIEYSGSELLKQKRVMGFLKESL